MSIEPSKPKTIEPAGKRNVVPPAPVHPLAALTTIVLDNVFAMVEIIDPFALLFTSLGLGALGFVTTMFVQKFLAHDGWGAAVAKGLVMGVIAGVPYPVTGTAIGVPLLVWAGAHQFIKLPALKDG
jgi:hypothetical protein